MNITSLTEELRSALKECRDAVSLVKSDDARTMLNDCKCSHNKFAKEKYGFAVGYCMSTLEKLLGLLDGNR